MFSNIFANYISRIWGLISVFFFVPFYIKILGLESYAIINFYTVILTIFYFADAGLSATLNREIAKTGDKKYIGDLVITIEKLYLVICTIIFIAIFFFSNYISTSLLKSNSITSVDIAYYIKLMGACVALQLFTTLENSGLLGLEKQVLSNGIQVSNSVFKSALVLIPLYFIPTLEMFFWWQVIVNLVFFFLTRYYLWKFIKSDYKPQFDKGIIKSVSGFAGGMMAMAIIASLNTQIDKLMVSKFLPLVDFGYYSIAAIISQAPVILITPIAIAILPRMVRLANIGDIVQLKAVFHKFSFLISSISIVITIILFLYSKDYILLWTKNPIIADKSFITAKLLIVGSLFLCFQYMPYHLAIANGHTSTNIRLGVVFLIFSIPSMFFFINKLGINGAALPWIIINFIAFFYLGYFLINKFLENEFKNWLLFDIFTPLISNLLIGSIAYLLTFHLPRGLYVVFYSFFIVLFSFVVNIIIFNKSNPNNRINILKILAN